MEIRAHVPEPVEPVIDIIGMSFDDAKLLLALLGMTYDGLQPLYAQLHDACCAGGFDALDELDDELESRLRRLLGPGMKL